MTNLAAAKARLAELRRQFEIDQIDAEVQVQVARAQLDRLVAEIPIASLRRQIALADWPIGSSRLLQQNRH